MKIPTGKYLGRKAANSLFRFPASIGFSLLSTILSVIAIENSYSFDNAPLLFKFLLTSILATPLFVALQLLNERMELNRKQQILIHAGGFLLLIFYFLSIPNTYFDKTLIRFFAYLALLALSVTFAPFIGIRQNFGFWKFNNIVIVRFLRTALYGLILFVAVSLAIVAVEQLFDVKLGEELYFELFVVIVLFFGTWFFLSAIPRYFDKLNNNTEYPNGLKIFVQFILIPIVILYSIILYAYFVKVIAIWDWPHGWVASLIIGYSMLSIFTFLIIFPIRKSAINTYVRFFSGFFPYLLWPLILILFISILKRISDYGITENRYFVLILGIWLLFIMTHLLMTRFRNIKIIPVSLAVVMFLTVTGPWSAFVVSKYSQTSRFESILLKYNKISNGVYKPSTDVMSFEDYNRLVSHMNYIIENYGHETFRSYFPKEIDTIKWDSVFVWEYSETNPLLDIMKIDFTEDSTSNSNVLYFRTRLAESGKMINISGYDTYCPLHIYSYSYQYDSTANNVFDYKYANTRVIVNSDSLFVKVFVNDTLTARFSVDMMLNNLPGNILRDSAYEMPERYMVKVDSTGSAILYIYSLSGNYFRGRLENLNELDGIVLIKSAR